MKKLAILIMVGSILFSGCAGKQEPVSPQIQLVVKHVGLTIENLGYTAVALYKAEQYLVITEGKQSGKSADDIKSEIAKVREKWEPVWSLIEDAKILEGSIQLILNTDPNNVAELIRLSDSLLKSHQAIMKQIDTVKK